MYKINRSVLTFFVEADRLSAFRVYTIIKDEYHGKIHPKDYKDVANKLGLLTINKHLKTLLDLGVLKYGNKGWLFLSKWRDFAPVKWNKIVDVSLAQLKNCKVLRSLFYTNHYRMAYKYARDNAKQSAIGRRPSWCPVSASFVKSVTLIGRSAQTLCKHIKRAAAFDLVKLKQGLTSVVSGSYEDCVNYREYNSGVDRPNYIIRKMYGVFFLFRYDANRIHFNLDNNFIREKSLYITDSVSNSYDSSNSSYLDICSYITNCKSVSYNLNLKNL